jgi:hypothetical protein
MKTTLLFNTKVIIAGALLMMTAVTSSAQINEYLMHNPVWRDSSSCAVPFPCIQQEGYNYYTAGDTVWNGLTYKKMLKKGTGVNNWFGPPPALCSGTYIYVDTVPAFLLRSAGKKMFIKTLFEPNEELLYDFDLDVGDTLPNTYNNLPGNIIYVTAIDSFYTPYGYRKIFTLAGANWAQYLIEGVGSSHGLIEPLGNFFDCGYQLLCFSLNDTSWYPVQGISCNIPLGSGELSDQSKMTVSPNPFSSEATIFSARPLRDARMVLINALGEVAEMRSGINGNSITLSKGSLSTGPYTVTITDETDSFRMKVVLTEM